MQALQQQHQCWIEMQIRALVFLWSIPLPMTIADDGKRLPLALCLRSCRLQPHSATYLTPQKICTEGFLTPNACAALQMTLSGCRCMRLRCTTNCYYHARKQALQVATPPAYMAELDATCQLVTFALQMMASGCRWRCA
jgi:hypothetical protein